MILTRTFIVLFIASSFSRAEPFFQDHGRGWHWYEILPIIEEVEDPQPEPAPGLSAPATPTQILESYRKELEHRLHTALVNPTPQTLKAYQVMQKDMMDRSKTFSTLWMQTVFAHPELDHTLVSPVNHQARHVQIDLEKERTAKTIQALSQRFGLFFFFSGECAYCHEFAPVVKQFAQTYDWDVVAISVDGGRLKEFPQAQDDNGLSKAWNIKALPSLYAINPHTRQAIPIAHGLTSRDDMENRIMMLATTLPTPLSKPLSGEHKP